MQGLDPYSGSGGGGAEALGVARSAPSRPDVGTSGGAEGLDDLSLSSVSSTLASFFLFLAVLR